MAHSLSEINQYTGFLCGLCFLALFLCLRALGEVGDLSAAVS
jgi:hypothetical protein